MIFSTHYTPGYATIWNDKTMFLIWLMTLHAALWSIYGAWNVNLSETQLKLNFLPKGCTDYFDGCSTSCKIETPKYSWALKFTNKSKSNVGKVFDKMSKDLGVRRLGQNSELSITINEKEQLILQNWWNCEKQYELPSTSTNINWACEITCWWDFQNQRRLSWNSNFAILCET